MQVLISIFNIVISLLYAFCNDPSLLRATLIRGPGATNDRWLRANPAHPQPAQESILKVSHPTYKQRFGIPGKTMVGSDPHTPAAGSLGTLAIGVGGLEVALAISGRPLHIRMPEVWGVGWKALSA